jgi:outer membrane receptor protein involved in Fe transport
MPKTECSEPLKPPLTVNATKAPASYTQAFPGPGTTGPTTHPDLKEFGMFVQDEWHVKSSLTLNAGLRYDKEDVAQPSVLNPDAQLIAAGYHTNRINTGGANIAPRLGFAWTPHDDNRTLIRGGYGVFYGRTPSIMYGTAHSNNGINVQTITFTGALIPAYPAIYSALPTGATLPKPTIFVFSPNFKQPKVEQSSLGVEHQIGNDFSVGVTYQYVKGTDLQRSRDINVGSASTGVANLATGGTVSFVKYNTADRPFANFARVIAFESSARSKYQGVTLDLQKRFSNNWQGRIAWTHATAKDDRPDATAVVPFSSGDDGKYASDPMNLARDYTYADADVRDRIVFSGVWSLDSYAQGIENGAMKMLASGWTLSGIVSYQTGQPYSASISTDLGNDGNPSNDLAPGFVRNSFRLPSQFEVSPRIARDIPLFGNARLQLIGEAFNLLNGHNVSNVTRTYYSYTAATNTLTKGASFGVPTATTGQRVVQVAARLTF